MGKHLHRGWLHLVHRFVPFSLFDHHKYSNDQHLIDSGCSDFQRILQPEMEKMGTLKADLLGTQNLKKVPMGTRVPKLGAV